MSLKISDVDFRTAYRSVEKYLLIPFSTGFSPLVSMGRRKASTEVPAAATTTSTSTVTPPAITYAATCFTLFVLFLFVLKLVGRSRQLASFTLTGKHIVITGGSSGIGKAIAAQVRTVPQRAARADQSRPADQRPRLDGHLRRGAQHHLRRGVS